MIAFLLIVILVILTALGVLFYYLHKRVESLSEKLIQFGSGMMTLRQNQDVLQSDIKKLRNEFQSNKKESKKEVVVKRVRE